MYDVKLPDNQTQKPTSFKKAGNSTYTQWFQAEAKEKDGMLNFNTWTRLDQHSLTPEMRRKALRCHHLYDIKRDHSAKTEWLLTGANNTRTHTVTQPHQSQDNCYYDYS
jgi:hypothetical protein